MRRQHLISNLRRSLPALLAASLIAAACGSDGESDPTDDAAGGDTTEESPGTGDETTDSDAPDGEGAAVDELIIAIGSEQGSLNPYTYSDGEGLLLLSLVHDTLLGLDAQNQPVALLASDWTASDDGLQWELTLRNDVTWHDGEPFDADDVAFTFDYVAQEANAHPLWTPGVASVESVEVVSPTNVVINLSAANADFAVRPLASMPILAEHVWADITDPQNAGVDATIGTGAYQLESYNTDQAYRLTANDDYAMGTPVAATVALTIVPEPSTSFAALRAGEVDMVSSIVEPQLVAEFEADDDFAVSIGPGFAATVLDMNTERPPLDDPEVRRAIGLAIDPQELIDSVLLGRGTAPNPGFLHPDGPLTVATPDHVFDPDAANALLDELGATTGDDGVRVLDGEPMRFEFLAPADNPAAIRTAEVISEQLEAVGIVAAVTVLDSTALYEQVWPEFDVSNGRSYDMSMGGWSPPVQLDAARFGSLLHSDTSIGTFNLTGLADPTIDALVDEMNAEGDPEERDEIIGELETQLSEIRPFVVLYYRDGAYAYRPAAFDGWTYQDGLGPIGRISLVDNS
jgi:peptide/nickel transport system substrate-binding protein